MKDDKITLSGRKEIDAAIKKLARYYPRLRTRSRKERNEMKTGWAIYDEAGDPIQGGVFVKDGERPDIFSTKANATSFRRAHIARGRIEISRTTICDCGAVHGDKKCPNCEGTLPKSAR